MQQLEKKIKAVFDRGFVFYLLLSYRCLHMSVVLRRYQCGVINLYKTATA